MFPVVYGEHQTRLHIFLYSLQLVALTFLLTLTHLGHALFLLAASVLGAALMYITWQVLREGGNRLTWRMYRYTSMYLGLLFTALVLDTLILA